MCDRSDRDCSAFLRHDSVRDEESLGFVCIELARSLKIAQENLTRIDTLFQCHVYPYLLRKFPASVVHQPYKPPHKLEEGRGGADGNSARTAVTEIEDVRKIRGEDECGEELGCAMASGEEIGGEKPAAQHGDGGALSGASGDEQGHGRRANIVGTNVWIDMSAPGHHMERGDEGSTLADVTHWRVQETAAADEEDLAMADRSLLDAEEDEEEERLPSQEDSKMGPAAHNGASGEKDDIKGVVGEQGGYGDSRVGGREGGTDRDELARRESASSGATGECRKLPAERKEQESSEDLSRGAGGGMEPPACQGSRDSCRGGCCAKQAEDSRRAKPQCGHHVSEVQGADKPALLGSLVMAGRRDSCVLAGGGEEGGGAVKSVAAAACGTTTTTTAAAAATTVAGSVVVELGSADAVVVGGGDSTEGQFSSESTPQNAHHSPTSAPAPLSTPLDSTHCFNEDGGVSASCGDGGSTESGGDTSGASEAKSGAERAVTIVTDVTTPSATAAAAAAIERVAAPAAALPLASACSLSKASSSARKGGRSKGAWKAPKSKLQRQEGQSRATAAATDASAAVNGACASCPADVAGRSSEAAVAGAPGLGPGVAGSPSGGVPLPASRRDAGTAAEMGGKQLGGGAAGHSDETKKEVRRDHGGGMGEDLGAAGRKYLVGHTYERAREEDKGREKEGLEQEKGEKKQCWEDTGREMFTVVVKDVVSGQARMHGTSNELVGDHQPQLGSPLSPPSCPEAAAATASVAVAASAAAADSDLLAKAEMEGGSRVGAKSRLGGEQQMQRLQEGGRRRVVWRSTKTRKEGQRVQTVVGSSEEAALGDVDLLETPLRAAMENIEGRVAGKSAAARLTFGEESFDDFAERELGAGGGRQVGMNSGSGDGADGEGGSGESAACSIVPVVGGIGEARGQKRRKDCGGEEGDAADEERGCNEGECKRRLVQRLSRGPVGLAQREDERNPLATLPLCGDPNVAAGTADGSNTALQGSFGAGKKSVGYKFVEVVRKKADREALKAGDCVQCHKFYEAIMEGDVAGVMVPQCEQHQVASRHRYRYEPPATPSGFWNIGFDSDA